MYIDTANPEAIVSAVTKMRIGKDDLVAVMVGEKERPDIDRLVSGLNREGIRFFGGVFPGLIYGNHQYEKGALVMPLPAAGAPHLVRGLDTEAIQLPDFGSEIFEHPGREYTAMILVDGLTSNISLFLSKVFNRFGNCVNYIGGGAGSLTMKQEPCLFTSEGFVQDAAIVAFLALGSSLGVRHGWERIMGPFVATRTKKNIIAELNWKNALEVYRETVENDSGEKITAENFFHVSTGYPFGIHKEGMEDIVRDPIAVVNGSELFCVGEVPENAVLSILKGKKASLIGAAGRAAEDCLAGAAGKIRRYLIVDCISRTLFLGDQFERELEAVQDKIRLADNGAVPMGMLTLGEISSYGEGFLEFFNKTIVVGALYEQ